MANDPTNLDIIVSKLTAEIASIRKDEPPVAPQEASTREIFLELLALSLGGLYGSTPMPSSLFDRAVLKSVTGQLPDTDAAKLINRAEDWVRLEGLVRVMEGSKSYTINRPSLAVLSTQTAEGTLGDVLQKLASCYQQPGPTPELRSLAQEIASYFLTRVGRG